MMAWETSRIAGALPSARNHRASAWRRSAGFSLLELMIVVVVIAILAAIVYPNYRESVLKSRRGQAKADLVEIAQILERRHTVDNQYGGPVPTLSDSSALQHYDFTPANIANGSQTFTLTATPRGAQGEDACGTLTLTSTGQKGNSSGTLADCW